MTRWKANDQSWGDNKLCLTWNNFCVSCFVEISPFSQFSKTGFLPSGKSCMLEHLHIQQHWYQHPTCKHMSKIQLKSAKNMYFCACICVCKCIVLLLSERTKNSLKSIQFPNIQSDPLLHPTYKEYQMTDAKDRTFVFQIWWFLPKIKSCPQHVYKIFNLNGIHSGWIMCTPLVCIVL